VSWHVAPSLLKLRDEYNRLFPHRDHTSDGFLGDAAHSSRVSDHNPDYNVAPPRYGVVRAGDFDVDDGDAARDGRLMLLKAAIGDQRTWYVISNGIIYSRTYGWTARQYNGPNPHRKHVHVSINHSAASENDVSQWFPNAPGSGGGSGKPTTNVTIAVEAIQLAAKGQPMNTTDDYFADVVQFLAHCRARRVITTGTETAWFKTREARHVVDAVRNLQRAGGLPRDGIFGSRTACLMAPYGYIPYIGGKAYRCP
jgi:hypothetical protein